jgi:bile acid:Na+ symporter, BASS family
METLAHILPIVLKLALLALVFALGLNAHFQDLVWLWKRPGLLLRSLLAMDVIVPLAALLLALFLDLPRPVLIGLLAMAVSPGAPFVPQKQMKLGGRLPYVYSLIVTVSLLAIVTIPLTVALASVFFPAHAWVEPREVAKVVGLLLLLPLGLGLAVRQGLPALADRLAKPLATVANVLLGALALLILVRVFPAMLRLGLQALLAIVLLTAVALAAGHLLGGPHPEDRTALAVASAARHPGLALLVANANFPSEGTVAVVLAYLVVSGLASIPYTVWVKRRRPAVPRGRGAVGTSG